MSTPSGKVVLVVDDNADVRLSLADLLHLFGFTVDTAWDGESALEYLRTHSPPSLIILDLRMPGMDGLQFLRVRSEHPSLCLIPVIVSTGELEETIPELPRDILVLPKTVNPMLLVQAILDQCT